MSPKKKQEQLEDDPCFHNTELLLKKYRDSVWSLEVSASQLNHKFRKEFGMSVDDFLDSLYMAGMDLGSSQLESQAQWLEVTRKMLALVDNAIEIMRMRHKRGEIYYWVLYLTYMTPQQLGHEEVMEQLAPHVKSMSDRSYYRYRREAINTLGSVLWGYTDRAAKAAMDDLWKSGTGA